MKFAITGATGFVGSRLVEQLQQEGHSVLVLSRSASRAMKIFPQVAFPCVEIVEYDPTQSGDWQARLSGCDGVVNLAGDSIADGRWTPKRKQEIVESRQLTTQKLVDGIAQAEVRPGVLVNASAIGYYGTSETATFDETSPPGEDFLAEVCKLWEAAARSVEASGTRLVILRIGIVLGNGGAIAKMIPPFRVFLGGPLGTGQQWFSWIHRDDLVALIIQALMHPEWSGTFNATAPNPVRMVELCDTLSEIIKRPSWLPVPGFALEALLGDAAKLVLEGQQVLPKRVLDTNFEYQYPTVKAALSQVVASM